MRRPSSIRFGLWILVPLMVGAPSVAQVPERIAGAALAGRVTNSSGEALSGATVAIPALSRGTLTNRGGDFRLDGLPTGPVTVRVEVLGHGTREVAAALVAGTTARIDIVLESSAIEIGAVTVTARRVEERAQEVPIPVAVVRGAQLESSTSRQASARTSS